MNGILTSLAIAAAAAALLVAFNLLSDSGIAGPLLASDPDLPGGGSVANEPAGGLHVPMSPPVPTREVTRMVDPAAAQALERAIRGVEEAEASYRRIEQELDTLGAELDGLDPEAVGPTTETFLVQAEPLLDQLIAAEEAVQRAKDIERVARAAVGDG